MLINWLKFLPALLLLLTPIGLFHGKKTRLRSLTSSWSGYWRQTFTLGLHWIDLGRAVLGTLLLREAIDLAPNASSLFQKVVPLAYLPVLGAAVVLQTFVCRDGDRAHAPFAFTAGLVLALYSPVVAPLALSLALVTALGTRTSLAFFFVLAATVFGLGFLLIGKQMQLHLAAISAIVITPWLLTIMFPRDLVVAYRAKRQTVAEATESATPRR